MRYVEHIGESAFVGTRLEKIYLQKCSELGRCAFVNMRNLREIAIQSELELIPVDCFKRCEKLQEISLPNSLKRIEDDAFSGCRSLRELQLPPNLKYFGDNVIEGDSLIKKLVIPDSVTEIGFYNYEFLKSITFGTGLNGLPYDYKNPMSMRGKIKEKQCENLEEIIIKDSEIEFQLYPFWNNSGEIPPFSNCDIKHYYVGRQLYGTERQFDGRYPFEDKYKCKQGETGHIGLLEIAGGCEKVPYFYQRIDTLLLGERVSEFCARNICVDSLKLIRCKSMTPPDIIVIWFGGYVSQMTYANLPVYVPKGSLAAYQAADGWKNFWEIREYDETTGISTVKTKPQETGHNYYDLQGRKLREPQKGINIINGKKVLIK